MNVHLVSLGCARNQVDSEVMLGRLQGAGWRITAEPSEAEVIIVNTCSFIEAAVSESLDTILELAKLKREAHCRHLIVVGCLPERYRENLAVELPEVDLFLGTGAFDRIVEAVEGRQGVARCLLPDPDRVAFLKEAGVRVRPGVASAYLKIAEGCSKTCTYCIIPKLRGRQRSRPPADILVEAAALAEAGAEELVLVAQDTTAYGRDLDPPTDLADLLEKLARRSPRTWIRFLYGHPESITEAVIRTVARHPNVCSYFDIPIQHVSPTVLRRMGRAYSATDLAKLFAQIKSRVPDAALRTTVIVGFPGETDQDFDMLLRFLDRVRFDHLGAFVYSDAEDLPSHRLPGHVSPRIARKRHDRVMAMQAGISLQNNQRHLGETYAVLVEEHPEAGLFAGRTFFQAPEVDGVTYIHGDSLAIGEFASVKITEALEYDLAGSGTMSQLKQRLLSLVKDDLDAIEAALTQNLSPHLDLVSNTARHILFSGGKRLRPLLMILAARICGYQGDDHATFSIIFEYLHAATLLHDDLVDGATLRRGKPVAHAIWGNSTTVLVGDFLLARSLSIAAQTKRLQVIQVIANITENMSLGEIHQLMRRGFWELSEEEYLEVIRRKTALLIQGACRVGALVADAQHVEETALSVYGYNLGLAFQIIDDLLDYTADTSTLGKGIGADLKEGKVTLPLIYALKAAKAADRRRMLDILGNQNLAADEFEGLRTLLDKNGGLVYSRQQAAGYIHRAKAQLAVFQPSTTREVLECVADYALERNV